MNALTREEAEEIVGRLRRLETRFTKFAKFMGWQTETREAKWSAGVVRIPSHGVSIKEILDTVPPDWVGAFSVTHWDGEHIIDMMPRKAR